MDMLQEADVQPAEVTASESSTVEQTPGPQQEEATIPKARLDKEIAKRKAAEERRKAAEDLLATYQSKKTEVLETKPEAQDFRSVEDWTKFIKKESQEAATRAADTAEARARASMRRDIEISELEKDEDFHILAPSIKAEIERNPTLSPKDAYYLAKAKNPILSRKNEEVMDKKVRAEVEAKQKAQVGATGTRQTPKQLDRTEIFARNAQGKYKYSLGEIEEMLKGTK